MPRVSVICAAHNHERFVGEAIESVLNQTHRDVELILVDDGSTDGTGEVARRYEPQIRVITQKNRGVVAARNRALAEATGEYVALLDSDDVYLPHKLEVLLAPLEADRSVGMAYSNADIVDVDGRSLGLFWSFFPPKRGDAARMLFLHYCFIHAAAVLVRRDVLTEVGDFYGPGPSCEYIKWIEVGLRYKVARVDDVTAVWRQHSSNISAGNQGVESYATALQAFDALFLKDPLAREELMRFKPRRYSRNNFYAGITLLARKEYEDARGYFRRGLRTMPSSGWNLLGLASSFWPWRVAAARVLAWRLRKAYAYRYRRASSDQGERRPPPAHIQKRRYG